MAIDRIGKNGTPPLAPTEVRPKEGSRPFEVDAKTPPGEPVEGKNAVSAVAPSPLEQLRAGRIDVNGYVDQKLEEATAHLHGLGKKEMAALKELLRAQIVSDPALVDLVTQVSGTIPSED